MYGFNYEIDGKMLLDTGVSLLTFHQYTSACSVGTKQGFSIVHHRKVDNGTAATVPHGISHKNLISRLRG